MLFSFGDVSSTDGYSMTWPMAKLAKRLSVPRAKGSPGFGIAGEALHDTLLPVLAVITISASILELSGVNLREMPMVNAKKGVLKDDH